jgi:hypothetical protein
MSKSNTKSITVPALIDPHQRYTIPESSAILRQSVAKTYKDIKVGNLRIIKDAARSYVPGAELIRRSTLPAS